MTSTDLAVRLADEVTALTDETTIAGLVQALRENLIDGVRGVSAREREWRPARVSTPADVAAEAVAVTRMHAKLDALAGAFKAAADECKAISADLVGDVLDRDTGSIECGTVDGSVKITVSQPTKVSVRHDEIVEVIAAALARANAVGERREIIQTAARIGMIRLLELIGPPTWKTTALEALGRSLEGRGDYDLAIRLGHSYARVGSGKLSIKIEHRN